MLNDRNFELDNTYKLVAIQWSEPWEFDHPSALLEPVFLYYTNGKSLNSIFEDFCIDVAVDESFPKNQTTKDQNIRYLKKVAREATKGKKFPIKNYQAQEVLVKFFKNNDGEVHFKIQQYTR